METGVLMGKVQGNETMATIFNRRAVRKYKNKPVGKKLLEQLLDAARIAPSAMNRQPWKFYVVTDRHLIHQLSNDIARNAFKDTLNSGIRGVVKAASGLLHFAKSFHFSSLSDPVFYGAPVVVFITSPANNEWARLDIGMCAQNMMLAATSLGLDTCPVGFGKFVANTEHFSSLKIPAGETVELSVIVGYGDEIPEVHPREQNNVTWIS